MATKVNLAAWRRNQLGETHAISSRATNPNEGMSSLPTPGNVRDIIKWLAAKKCLQQRLTTLSFQWQD